MATTANAATSLIGVVLAVRRWSAPDSTTVSISYSTAPKATRHTGHRPLARGSVRAPYSRRCPLPCRGQSRRPRSEWRRNLSPPPRAARGRNPGFSLGRPPAGRRSPVSNRDGRVPGRGRPQVHGQFAPHSRRPWTTDSGSSRARSRDDRLRSPRVRRGGRPRPSYVSRLRSASTISGPAGNRSPQAFFE
jgi:hypothetical protein